MSVKSEPSVWLLNDQRPGHWRQVRALAHYLPASNQELRVQLKNPWRFLAPRSWPGGLAAHPGILADLPRTAPAAIISCGRRSALVARWLRHYFKGQPKTVQILDCGLAPDRFSWVIAPRHDRLSGPNVITSLGSLNPIDEEWLEKASQGLIREPNFRRPGITLLTGGPSRHFDFSPAWFSDIIAQVRDLATRLDGSVVVLESARTPAWVREMAEACAGPPLIYLPWRQHRPLEMETLYAQAVASADCLVPTADSVNQVSEASAAARPVLVAGSQRAEGKIGRFCRRMMDDGYLRPLEGVDINTVLGVKTRCLRETETIATQLVNSGLFKSGTENFGGGPGVGRF